MMILGKDCTANFFKELTRVPRSKKKYGKQPILKPSDIRGKSYYWDFPQVMVIYLMLIAGKNSISKPVLKTLLFAFECAVEESPKLLDGYLKMFPELSKQMEFPKLKESISPFEYDFLATWPQATPHPEIILTINGSLKGQYGSIKLHEPSAKVESRVVPLQSEIVFTLDDKNTNQVSHDLLTSDDNLLSLQFNLSAANLSLKKKIRNILIS